MWIFQKRNKQTPSVRRKQIIIRTRNQNHVSNMCKKNTYHLDHHNHNNLPLAHDKRLHHVLHDLIVKSTDDTKRMFHRLDTSDTPRQYHFCETDVDTPGGVRPCPLVPIRVAPPYSWHRIAPPRRALNVLVAAIVVPNVVLVFRGIPILPRRVPK